MASNAEIHPTEVCEGLWALTPANDTIHEYSELGMRLDTSLVPVDTTDARLGYVSKCIYQALRAWMFSTNQVTSKLVFDIENAYFVVGENKYIVVVRDMAFNVAPYEELEDTPDTSTDWFENTEA